MYQDLWESAGCHHPRIISNIGKITGSSVVTAVSAFPGHVQTSTVEVVSFKPDAAVIPPADRLQNHPAEYSFKPPVGQDHRPAALVQCDSPVIRVFSMWAWEPGDSSPLSKTPCHQSGELL